MKTFASFISSLLSAFAIIILGCSAFAALYLDLPIEYLIGIAVVGIFWAAISQGIAMILDMMIFIRYGK